MYIPINLATEPFRRDRPVLVASVICAVLLAGLLAVQGYLILGERAAAADNHAAVDDLRMQLVKIQADQNAINATLLNPVNAEVLTRSLMLNGLVQRKSISWARLLSDLGGVLPNNVRLMQIRLPQVNSRNEVTLDMEVGALRPDQVVQFMHNLEASSLFGPVNLARQEPPSQNEPLFKARLTVSYAQKL